MHTIVLKKVYKDKIIEDLAYTHNYVLFINGTRGIVKNSISLAIRENKYNSIIKTTFSICIIIAATS